MANWSDLKAAVAEVIKTNGNQEITGQTLQETLNSIISNVGKDSTFAGIATPTTNPGTPDGNLFYLATEPGTYANFNGIKIADGEAVIFEWRGSWTKKTSGFATQKKLTELEIITPIKSVPAIEVSEYKYINSDGTILNATQNYKLIKFYSSGGNYFVYSPYSLSSDTLWKYTDETYNTPEKQIIGKVDEKGYTKNIVLQSGYYAFCYNNSNGNDGFIVNEKSYIVRCKKDLRNSQVISCKYNIDDIESALYINSDGIISDSVDSFKLVKLYISSGLYYIYNIGNIHPILYRYTDESYTIPDDKIIGSKREGYDSFVYLKEGYYAFCWKSSSEQSLSEEALIIPMSKSLANYIYKSYINALFNGVTIIDLLIGYSINPTSGNLTSEGVEYKYKLAKMYLSSGRYNIISPGSLSQGHFWKYTDKTFNTPEIEIISNHESQSISIDLEEGYYAFCWNDGVNEDSYNSIITNNVLIEKTKEPNDMLGCMNIIGGEILVKCAITPNTGIIRTDVTNMYKLAKIFLSEGNYLLKTVGSSTQDTLWKYTDETYNTPEKQIIGKVARYLSYEEKTIQIYLEEGYYAFCWNDGNSIGITHNSAFVIPISSYSDIEKNYGTGISDYSGFSALNSSFEISEDKNSATSLLTGYANRLQYSTNLYEDKFCMSTTIKPLSGDSNGYFEFCFGKWYNLSGTIFSIGKDSEGSFMAVYFVGSSSVPTMSYKYKITEFPVDLDKRYYLTINKRTDSQSYFDISITNERGLVFNKIVTGKSTGEEDTENEGNGSDAGYGWGKMCYYAILGKMHVSDINYGYPVNKTSLKLICSGHSFVEGNSIYQYKDKRYVYLLCNDLGLDNTIILGQGGATTTSILEHINIQLSWLKNASYILFSIGTNDTDNTENANRLGQINSIAEGYGIKTIWLTISPRKGVGEDHPIMNDYIKENFNYVDINPAFYLEDGVTLDTSAFLDDVHPTIDTHEKIYEIIKSKCTYLYCL